MQQRAWISVVQSPTDLAILTKFAQMLRDGDIGGQKFSKIVGVGHSYGSAQLQGLTVTAPNAVDAVLLQGFSHNGYVYNPMSNHPWLTERIAPRWRASWPEAHTRPPRSSSRIASLPASLVVRTS